MPWCWRRLSECAAPVVPASELVARQPAAGRRGCRPRWSESLRGRVARARPELLFLVERRALEVSLLHLGEELFRLFSRFDGRFVGGIVRQISVVLLAESLGHFRVAAALGCVLFSERYQLAIVHNWSR